MLIKLVGCIAWTDSFMFFCVCVLYYLVSLLCFVMSSVVLLICCMLCFLMSSVVCWFPYSLFSDV